LLDYSRFGLAVAAEVEELLPDDCMKKNRSKAINTKAIILSDFYTIICVSVFYEI
jgi:hypothetical protein